MFYFSFLQLSTIFIYIPDDRELLFQFYEYIYRYLKENSFLMVFAIWEVMVLYCAESICDCGYLLLDYKIVSFATEVYTLL